MGHDGQRLPVGHSRFLRHPFLFDDPAGQVTGFTRSKAIRLIGHVDHCRRNHGPLSDPPTPGPLLVASQLQVPVGWMMIGGLVVGLFTCWIGQVYARWANQKWPLPMRDSGGITFKELEDQAQVADADLPPLWASLLPILLPVALITLQSLLSSWGPAEAMHSQGFVSRARAVPECRGEKHRAHAGSHDGHFPSLSLPGQSVGRLRSSLEEALSQGGLILLITSAGGAFGGILQHTGIAEDMRQWASHFQLALLPLAFGLTALGTHGAGLGNGGHDHHRWNVCRTE